MIEFNITSAHGRSTIRSVPHSLITHTRHHHSTHSVLRLSSSFPLYSYHCDCEEREVVVIIQAPWTLLTFINMTECHVQTAVRSRPLAGQTLASSAPPLDESFSRMHLNSTACPLSPPLLRFPCVDFESAAPHRSISLHPPHRVTHQEEQETKNYDLDFVFTASDNNEKVPLHPHLSISPTSFTSSFFLTLCPFSPSLSLSL
jgi:hypothetical protein